MLTRYSVSKIEVSRRQTAFFSLSLFLIIGLFIGSKILNISIPTVFYLLSLAILAISNIWIKLFFNKFLKMKILLSDKFLERKTTRKIEKYSLSDIEKIKVKKTSKNAVREIYIYLKNNQSIFINGLDNFEAFTDKLLKLTNKNTIVKYFCEPLDFDSPFFYPILELILSFITVSFLRLMMTLNYRTTLIIFYCLLVYIFLLTIYLILSKPISKRY